MPQGKILYIGLNDVFSRHELGFIAALADLGKVDIVVLGSRLCMYEQAVGSDNGVHVVSFYEVPCKNITRLRLCIDVISSALDIKGYDAVFATPRLPLVVARALGFNRVILRLWSIRAAKLRDNLRFGAYEDIFLFMPSVLSNLYYVLNSTYAMTVDHATYSFAKKVYALLANRLLKVYPPYGFIKEKSYVEKALPEIIERGGYVLGFTILSKKGAYLKFEARPHAIILYLLAKKTGVDVVLAGSSLEDWRQVFPGIQPPKNLHIIGRGFSDNDLAKIYRNALLVVAPISNRNISNRLLEALFYGKPIITSEVVNFIHPELEHGKHLYVSSWSTIIEDFSKIYKDEELLRVLEQGAKEAYYKLFSTKRNVNIVKGLLE